MILVYEQDSPQDFMGRLLNNEEHLATAISIAIPPDQARSSHLEIGVKILALDKFPF